MICPQCYKDKEHSWLDRGKICLLCQWDNKIAVLENGNNSREIDNLKIKIRNQRRVEKNVRGFTRAGSAAKRFVFEYKQTHPCEECGEANPVVLQFHHIRDKEHNVAQLLASDSQLGALKEEIAKCIVLCSNCHVKRTARERNWDILRRVENGK